MAERTIPISESRHGTKKACIVCMGVMTAVNLFALMFTVGPNAIFPGVPSMGWHCIMIDFVCIAAAALIFLFDNDKN